jgi:hypothetical protein
MPRGGLISIGYSALRGDERVNVLGAVVHLHYLSDAAASRAQLTTYSNASATCIEVTAFWKVERVGRPAQARVKNS